MSIAEDKVALEAVKEKLEEAWDAAANAKELAAEANDMLREIAGDDIPETLQQAHDMTKEGQGQVEQGQGLFSASKERITEYVDTLGG